MVACVNAPSLSLVLGAPTVSLPYGGSSRWPSGAGSTQPGPGNPPQGPARSWGLGDIFIAKNQRPRDGSFRQGPSQVTTDAGTGGRYNEAGETLQTPAHPRSAPAKTAGGGGWGGRSPVPRSLALFPLWRGPSHRPPCQSVGAPRALRSSRLPPSVLAWWGQLPGQSQRHGGERPRRRKSGQR